MSGMALVIQMNIDEADKTLGGILKRLENSKKAFDKIAHFLKNKFIGHFDRQQGHTAKWKPLSPAAIKTRKKIW